jgi:hypothetical protein
MHERHQMYANASPNYPTISNPPSTRPPLLDTKHQTSNVLQPLEIQLGLRLIEHARTAPNSNQYIRSIHNYKAPITPDTSLPPYSKITTIATTPTHYSSDNEGTAWTASNMRKEKTFIPGELQQHRPPVLDSGTHSKSPGQLLRATLDEVQLNGTKFSQQNVGRKSPISSMISTVVTSF